jgi:hypothetical protein
MSIFICTIRRLFIFGVLLFLGYSGQKIPAEGPFEWITIKGNKITIQANSKATLAEILDLEVFADFDPNIRIEQAVDRRGHPDNVRIEDEKRRVVYEYWTHKARIELSLQDLASGTYSSLTSFPKDMLGRDLFARAIAKHIKWNPDGTFVEVRDRGGDTWATVQLKGSNGRVEWISLIKDLK